MQEQEFPNVETGVPIVIVRVSSEDRNGNPLVDRLSGDRQKAISLYLPWEGFRFSKYGITTYLRESQVPKDLKSGDTRYCRVIRQSIRTRDMFTKDGQLDGSEQWHWEYSIAEWDVDRESTLPVAQQPVATPPSQQPANQKPVEQQPVATEYKPQEEKIPDNQMKIMRQSALKCASWIVVPTVAEMGIETSVKKSMEIANLFLDYVITGEIPKSKKITGTDSLDGVVPEMTQDINEEWN